MMEQMTESRRDAKKVKRDALQMANLIAEGIAYGGLDG